MDVDGEPVDARTKLKQRCVLFFYMFVKGVILRHFCVVWCGGLCDFSVSRRSQSFFCSILGDFYSIWGAH